MITQTEALRLALLLENALGNTSNSEAAAELRRLYDSRFEKEREELEQERNRLHEVNREWERKAATWLASPEAAQRLDGYRELAQRINYLETMNQELLEALREWKEFWDAECETGEKTVEKMLTAISKATGEQS